MHVMFFKSHVHMWCVRMCGLVKSGLVVYVWTRLLYVWIHVHMPCKYSHTYPCTDSHHYMQTCTCRDISMEKQMFVCAHIQCIHTVVELPIRIKRHNKIHDMRVTSKHKAPHKHRAQMCAIIFLHNHEKDITNWKNRTRTYPGDRHAVDIDTPGLKLLAVSQ